MDEIELEPIDGIFQDLAEAEIIPPKWVIEDFLPVGLVFLVAPPKAGKSTVTMAAACLVAGYECKALPPAMSRVPKTGCVMAFSYEAAAGELRHMVQVGLGVTPRADQGILIADDPWKFRLDDAEGLKQLMYWLNQRKPHLVILDPLRDFHHLDEKDSGDMNRLLRPIRQWAMQNDACVIVAHHTKKPGEGHQNYDAMDMRGTTALFGIADGILIFTPKNRSATRIRIAATFKKGRPWERTVQLAAYDDVDKPACEVFDDKTKQVLQTVAQHGPIEQDALCDLLGKMDHADVREALYALKRNLLVWQNKNQWGVP